MASITLYATCAFITLLSLYAFRVFATKSLLPTPPGPPPLPIIGNAHQAPKSHAWLQYHTWSKTYGPIIHLNMLGQSVIILSTSKAAHDLLSKRGATFSDRPRLVVSAELALKGMHMLLRPYDERFRLHQRLENPVLNPRAANSYLSFQGLESKQLLFDLLNDGGVAGIDCHGHFERTTASIIYALFYGYRLKSSSEPELVAARSVNDEFGQLAQVGAYLVDSFPILNNLPGFLAPWKAEAERHWSRQRALHVGNLQRGLQGSEWNFSKQMKSTLESEGIDMPIEELALDLGIMADAAMDASTETMMWFVVACVTENQEFITKAQKDLDAIIGRDRLPTFEDKPKLLYIEAIMEELLRWRPAGAAGVPHFTKIESSYEGYRIPAGSVVIANHWAITREEAVFGPKVEAFIPERWLDSKSGQGPKSSSEELRDIPTVGFGYGRRICPGRHIARNSLWITIARLLWAFNIEPGLSESGERVAIDSLAATDGLVTKPLPFKVAFKPRGQWVRDIITRECNTHDMCFADILSQIGADLAAD
ncbi:cytochrome P450 [Biscogniauxia marginata]|nr:cytochrome P450 [Biscogniauxia marginata]